LSELSNGTPRRSGEAVEGCSYVRAIHRSSTESTELAGEEARRVDHGFVGTEYILLGLIREGEGLADKALESLGISLELEDLDASEITVTSVETTDGPGLMFSVKHRIEEMLGT
jgi:hypothetical protein